MSEPDFDEDQLLRDARAKTQKLIASLMAQRDDLDRFAGQIAPDRLAQGQRAFADAIGSTRQTLDRLEKALCAGKGSGPNSRGT